MTTAELFRPDSLAYLAMQAQDTAQWGEFARAVLGGSVHAARDGGIHVRFDHHLARLRVMPGQDGQLDAVGWDCSDESAWDGLCEQLHRAGCTMQVCDAAQSQTRGFARLARGHTPFGHPIEIVCGPVSAADASSPACPCAHLGHVVLGVPDLPSAEAFYMQALGLRVTDRITFEKMGRTIELSFMRAADGRHHSLALVGGMPGINHLMVELGGVDAVGRSLDMCRLRGDTLRRELGRHSNDLMYSFYARSPNGVDVEVGCDGIAVDESAWQVKHLDTTSLWGHRLL